MKSTLFTPIERRPRCERRYHLRSAHFRTLRSHAPRNGPVSLPHQPGGIDTP